MDIASKHELIKARKSEISALEKKVESLVRTWAADEAPPRHGCIPTLSSCLPFWKKHSAVQKETVAGVTAGSEKELKQSGDRGKLLMRMIGSRKEQSGETEKIMSAIELVQLRVESLSDRAKIGRERALLSKTNGKKEEALRELKKAKNIEKQLSAARAALDTLERQQDMVAESALQRELATALKSTTQGIKNKSKGLLSLAESAIDSSIEVRDEVDDVAAVFEGITPYETGVDDDELLEELENLSQDSVGDLPEVVEIQQTEQVSETKAHFPVVPDTVICPKPMRAEERASLLASG